jgi:hypothetical protein
MYRRLKYDYELRTVRDDDDDGSEGGLIEDIPAYVWGV